MHVDEYPLLASGRTGQVCFSQSSTTSSSEIDGPGNEIDGPSDGINAVSSEINGASGLHDLTPQQISRIETYVELLLDYNQV